MDKAIIIQDEIRSKLADLVAINPAFEAPSREINVLLYKLRAEDLESYKSKELQEDANKRFDSVVQSLNKCVKNGYISNIQAHGLIQRVGDMRQADFDYLINDYLPRISNHFKGIHESFVELEKTLDRACGRGEPEVKEGKFQKIISNIFNFRKSNENNDKSKNPSVKKKLM
jgi:hypothetical protein